MHPLHILGYVVLGIGATIGIILWIKNGLDYEWKR